MEKDIKSMSDDKNIYDELSVAFGKNGVQALLIEQTLPILQDESNELLNRLTEGKLSIKFQLMQGKKGANWKLGVPSEELEILISDESGTRNYELYSGGEAFRINFAVRIALSKLLANRSGAPLPILFIDEGFGSQDQAGQELLIEILQNIKSDFEKILVVTHIEEIKEAFPTRIEVEKTDQVSSFTIV
jgi:exonuclease SbcC